MTEESVPVAVVIPTYRRGDRVLETLKRVESCRPGPREIYVHVDQSDGELERVLANQYPNVGILSSKDRLGPGGGRHRALSECTSPYAVSFDDDSYPVDDDFFKTVFELFESNPDVAVFESTIWHRHQPEIERTDTTSPTTSFTGCGHAVRLAAYRGVRGYLPRPIAYGIEEHDVYLQLFAANWKIMKAGALRVFHDSELKHHRAPEIVAGTIANVGLFAYLHYPWQSMMRGLLQVGNMTWFCIRNGRLNGIVSGLCQIPTVCRQYRSFRRPVEMHVLRRYFEQRSRRCE